MSQEKRGAPDPADGVGKTVRVGTAEREEAIAALGDHWRAGRLDPGEHELRVTRARAAVTRADLSALFADLPPSGPFLEPAATAACGGTRGFLGDKRDTIIALTPFVALALFFLTSSWLWFLLVPVMGILLYGPGGGRSAGQRRR